jgi:hypothetical protein
MYDSSGCGANLRKYVSLSLAWWHNYKWATKQVVRVFGSDIFVPLHHHLFPDRTYSIDKVTLTSQATYLSYIRLAYPLFRQALSNALSTPGLLTNQRAILTNLSDLCEFFIPVVCMYFIFMSLFNVLH